LIPFPDLNRSLALVVGALGQFAPGDALSLVTWQENVGVRGGAVEPPGEHGHLLGTHRHRRRWLSRIEILMRIARVRHEAVGLVARHYLIFGEDLLVAAFRFEWAVVPVEVLVGGGTGELGLLVNAPIFDLVFNSVIIEISNNILMLALVLQKLFNVDIFCLVSIQKLFFVRSLDLLRIFVIDDPVL
jgi:hypothetical protein